ncbi:MAG: hypothetical protein ABSG81_09140 [Acidimicrobiales bacterium]|jgi:quinol monooxygenase YgiN
MWAQLITARLKPGKEGDLSTMVEQLKATEQPGSGLVRSMVMHDQSDPRRIHILAVFESEEKARARESDAARQEALAGVREIMASAFEGAPEFLDLVVIEEFTL